MQRLTLFGSALLTVALCACARAGATAGGGDGIAQLEREQLSDTSSLEVNRALGIAYFQARRYPEARATLGRAARLDPTDGITALYLGLTAEEQNDLPAAKAAYSSYVQFGRTSRVRRQLEARLAALARKELVADAKAAVAHESVVTGIIGPPTTVAVMPLRFSGTDSSLKPLERGFADLLTTDLARSSRLTLVERSRLQALLDEMALQKAGATDDATSARAGRLLRAGSVVQGSMLQLASALPANPELRVDAAVVDVPSTQVKGTARASDQLTLLFDLEKRLALDLFRELGVTLSVAERNQVEQRPTRSLAAFLTYSRGLVAEDAGELDAAGRYFDQAARIDPGFGAAQTKAAEAKQASIGATVTPQTVQASLSGSIEQKVATAASHGQAGASPASPPPGGSALGNAVAEAVGALNSSSAGSLTGAATTAIAPPPPPTSTQGNTPPAASPAVGKIVITLPRVP